MLGYALELGKGDVMAGRAFTGGGADLRGGSIAGASFHPPVSRFGGGPLPLAGWFAAMGGGGGGTIDEATGPGDEWFTGGCNR